MPVSSLYLVLSMLTDVAHAPLSPYALGKLYTNTLLVIFNNRIRLPKNSSDDDSNSLKVIASVHTPPRISSHSSSNTPPNDQVVVTILRESDAPCGSDLEAQSNESGTVTPASHLPTVVRRQTPPSGDAVSERLSVEILKPQGIAF